MKEKLAEMAIQIFAVESMMYRSGRKYEAAMNRGDRGRADKARTR